MRWSGQSLEAVGNPHGSIGYSPQLQKRAHKNAGSTAPHTGLQQITRNALVQHRLDAELQIVETLQTHHGIADAGPIRPQFARLGVEWNRLENLVSAFIEECKQAPLDRRQMLVRMNFLVATLRIEIAGEAAL